MLGLQIGFVGGGQMARALAAALVRGGLVAGEQIVVHDPAQAAVERFVGEIGAARVAGDNQAVVSAADVVLLAVKPQQVAQAARQARTALTAEKLVVSIVAGVTLAQLAEQLGTERIVRVMPNTPCLVGQGASGYALGPGATPEDGQLVEQLLSAVGVAFRLEESQLDAVTGLSGSGPAYVFMIIEALSDGGVRMGLPRAAATALAAQTVLGAAAMVQSTGEHPAVLKDRVASPAGTTMAGLQELEQRGLRAALIAAVQAATRRSTELGRSTPAR